MPHILFRSSLVISPDSSDVTNANLQCHSVCFFGDALAVFFETPFTFTFSGGCLPASTAVNKPVSCDHVRIRRPEMGGVTYPDTNLLL